MKHCLNARSGSASCKPENRIGTYHRRATFFTSVIIWYDRNKVSDLEK